jgi:molybdopterin molybdotransferase
VSGFVGLGRAEVVRPEELISVEEHLAGILGMLAEPEPIDLRLSDALGLVLGDFVSSQVTLPAFANAAMDGYAVVAADLEGASPDAPVTLAVEGEVTAGAHELPRVTSGHVVRIMTGAPVPPGADAVVPVETTSGGEGRVAFHHAVAAGAHIRRPGEDLTPGQPLVAAGRRVSPADIGLLAAAGATRVPCIPPPRVVVLSSGDELVRPEDDPGPGRIRDANGPMMAAMIKQAGGLPFSAGIVPDDRKSLMYAFDTNLGHADLFVCTGGASAGTRDLLPDVIGALGEVHTAKVAMKPGMPQIRGRIGQTPVIGLPGNPVSAFVSFEVFVRPAIRRLQGRRDVARPTVLATLAEPLGGAPGKRAYLRVRLAREDGRWVASAAGAQGSHVISSIARADGLAIMPEEVDSLAAGDEVRVQLLVD